MGSKQSKPWGRKAKKAKKGKNRALEISGPINVLIHIPRNRVDLQGRPVIQVTRDIERDALLAALRHVSDFVRDRGQHVSVVCVGGAVNVLLLKSRTTTHDVDVFGSDWTNPDRVILDEAMHSAQQAIPDLGTDWLNTEPQMWMPGPLHEHLTTAARTQNVIVYQSDGLTIYAAPWDYAFSAKISRLTTDGSQVREHDLSDAVTYLRQYILKHGGGPIPVSTVQSWSERYHHNFDGLYLRNVVDIEYQRVYKCRALV